MNSILLNDMAEELGQVETAKKIGCHQTAISSALKKGRKIYIEVDGEKVVSGYEIKPALGLALTQKEKA